jgi:hypothetical protein
MAGSVLVVLCNASDYDTTTGTCAAPYYGDPPSAIPALSIADAQTIGMECALLWATAWSIRMCKRALKEIG